MSYVEHIERIASELDPEVVRLRRAIHRHPEPAYEEFKTTALVKDTLEAAGLSPRARTPKTGLVVDVGSGSPTVAFRADLDALPISEPPGLPFASEVQGMMHACGHDAHTAIAVGVAIGLHRMGDLGGRVRFIFQPAEENFPGGAYDMAKEGVVDGVASVIAFHVDPTLPVGLIGLRPGAITSSTDRFVITLEGPGGHTARPHQTVDLAYAAGKVLTDLPPLLHARIDPRRPTVIVFGRVNGGSADNVIPTHIEMSGTCRTQDRDLWDDIPSMVDRLVADIVAPTGAKATVHYQRGIPPVINDPAVVGRLRASMGRQIGADRVSDVMASMGAEDFSRFAELVPGALIRLGCKPDGVEADLHSARFMLDEAALRVGVRAAMAALIDELQTAATIT